MSPSKKGSKKKPSVKKATVSDLETKKNVKGGYTAWTVGGLTDTRVVKKDGQIVSVGC